MSPPLGGRWPPLPDASNAVGYRGQWRERRRLSQLELALETGISARHLSLVETGRSKPGRDMLLRVLGKLDVPFREQNGLLLAAGSRAGLPRAPAGRA